MKKFVIIFGIITTTLFSYLIFSVYSNKTHAQTPQELGIDEQVSINSTPKNPKPGDLVTTTIEAYGTDLNNSDISWSVNGISKDRGIGMTTFSTKVEKNGSYLTIKASIKTTAGNTIEKSVVVSSQDVDLLWEGKGYTPPFYKGKSLYTQESSIKLLAIPNMYNKSGVKLNPSELVYTWRVNDTVLGSLSGYGKNSLNYDGSILLDDTTIEVTVTAQDGTQGEAIIVLSAQKPVVLMYENNPLNGIMFNKSIGNNYQIKGKEITIESFPYNFSVSKRDDSTLEYSWAINNAKINAPKNQSFAVFRNNSDQRGSSVVKNSIYSSNKIYQQDTTEANINF